MKKQAVLLIGVTMALLFSVVGQPADPPVDSVVPVVIDRAYKNFDKKFKAVRPSDAAKVQAAAKIISSIFLGNAKNYFDAHRDLKVSARFVNSAEFPDCQGEFDSSSRDREYANFSWRGFPPYSERKEVEVLSRQPLNIIVFTELQMEKTQGDLWLRESNFSSFKMSYDGSGQSWSQPELVATARVWEKIMPDNKINKFASCLGSNQTWNVTTGQEVQR